MNQIKNKSFKFAGLIIAISIISACSKDFENPVGESGSYNKGTVDFSKYVSIGDSLTAGYADGALYLEGQKNSIPAILAQQFGKVDSLTFTQPLVSDNLGGLLFGGNPSPDFENRFVLNANPKNPPTDTSPIGPVRLEGTPTTEVFELLTATFNNMGVPGAKSFHLAAPGYGDPAGLTAGSANPYFIRFASSITTTVITDAAAQQPSFFTFWVGNNDLLSYATNGGDGTDQTGNTNPSTYGSDDITDPGYFAGVYASLLGALKTANPNAKGVLVNIPDVKSIPYFNAVPYNAIPLDQTTVDKLNIAYTDYNNGVQAALDLNLIDAAEATFRTITFSAGQNAIVMLDEDLTDITGVNAALINMRQATKDDLLTLLSSKILGTLADPNNPDSAWGVAVPLGDEYVLIQSEIDAINAARVLYNKTIKETAAADDNLVLFDVATFLSDLKTSGYNFGTGYVDATFGSGGAFSLDGVHPTARGYAILANQIIRTINTGFNANIPTVDPGTYPTVTVQ